MQDQPGALRQRQRWFDGISIRAPRHHRRANQGRLVRSHFLSSGQPSPRDLYRAAFLDAAATPRVNNWTREADKPAEAFWEAAYNLITGDFPILEMKRCKVTKDAAWITFRPSDMPTQPRTIYVSVKGDRGQMDLTFSGVQAHQLHELVHHLLEPDMTIHQTAASAASLSIMRDPRPWAIRNPGDLSHKVASDLREEWFQQLTRSAW